MIKMKQIHEYHVLALKDNLTISCLEELGMNIFVC